MDINQQLKDLDIVLPAPPAKGGLYTSARWVGQNLIYISGCGPVLEGQPAAGKLGNEYSIQQGQQFARNCMLNVLSVLQAEIKDLNRVKSVAKILVFVACADDFYEHPQVANGGSQLLKDVFGDPAGVPARSAIGVNALPGNIPVEIEAIFEIKED